MAWEKIQSSVLDLTRCMHRSKRSLDQEALLAVEKITWVAAFNFILSQGERLLSNSPVEIGIKLGNIVYDLAMKKFFSHSAGTTSEQIIISASEVSDSAAEHPDDVRGAVSLHVHPLESFRRRYLDEVVAAEVMLSPLKRACSQGKVDTQALAELSSEWELLKIQPENTIIEHVDYNVMLNQLTFTFDAIIDKWFWETADTSLIVAFVGTLVLCAGFGAVGFYTIRGLKTVKEETERAYETLRRSSVRASTMTLARTYSAREQYGLTTFMPRSPSPGMITAMEAGGAHDATATPFGFTVSTGVPNPSGGVGATGVATSSVSSI